MNNRQFCSANIKAVLNHMVNDKKGLVLAIDYGTQSVRSILVDTHGEIVAKAQIKFAPYFSVKPGWAEQHAETYWTHLCNVIKDLKKQCDDDMWNRIIAVSATTIRDTCVCLDKNNNPLRPIILWLDQRLADCSEQLPPTRVMLYKMSGMMEVATAQMKASHCNWIRENEPEIWEKTSKFVMFSCYINYRLTGRLVDSIASQIGHVPFNYRRKQWMTPLDLNYYIWNIEKSKLPDLVEPGTIIGYIDDKVSLETSIPKGTPVIVSGSDKGCETIATSCNNKKMASLSFGTTATVQITSDKYFEPLKFLPCYNAVLKNYYNPEIQVYRGYWMLTWFRREFAEKEEKMAQKLGVSAEELLNKTLKDVPAGCDGLILQPYWSPTLKAPEGKGAIIGFSDVHSRAHLYRAIIEGIGYGLMDGLRNIEKKMGLSVDSIAVSGGGSQNDQICQITADMFGVPVKRIQTYEACGLGAAMVAFVGMGVFETIEEASANMVRYVDEFLPDKETHDIYDKLYNNVYKVMYKQLKPLYNSIRDIIKLDKAIE